MIEIKVEQLIILHKKLQKASGDMHDILVFIKDHDLHSEPNILTAQSIFTCIRMMKEVLEQSIGQIVVSK